MSSSSSTLVITGGGLVGMAAAILFSHRFDRILIYEKRSNPLTDQNFSNRSLQLVISARGWRTLDLLGISDKIKAHTLQLKGRYKHEKDGSTHHEPYASDGQAICCICRETLYRLLTSEVLTLSNTTVFFDTEVTGLDPAARTYCWKNSEMSDTGLYDFMIGSDGVHSIVSRELNGDKGIHRVLESNSYREIRIANAPWATNGFHYWFSEKMMMGSFPVFEGGYSLFMVLERQDIDLILGDTDSAYLQNHFPEITALIPDARQRFLNAADGILGSVTCDCWHAGNHTVIIGDAAHGILPFMGQGLNTGLEDLFVLDEYLSKNGLKTEKSLSDFAASRRPQSDAIRDISMEQFRYLTGKMTQSERSARKEVEKHLEEHGLPGVYASCAFTTEPFADIQERIRVLNNRYR
ncbi:MAG: kynurenine 3-monooxygenase [Bacteroidota bacterium]